MATMVAAQPMALGRAQPCAAPFAARPSMAGASLLSRAPPRRSVQALSAARRPEIVAAASPASSAAPVAAAAPPAPAQKIRIKLKSYWVDLLQDSVEKIREAATSTGATIAGPVPLPTK
jgi:small subunit ribosomal protein S10